MNRFMSPIFKTKLFSYSLVIVLLTFFLVACNGTEPVLNDISLRGNRASALEDPFGYTTENLKKMGKGVILAAGNGKFKDLVYGEIEKKFDGDYNVLIKTLTQKGKEIQVDLSEKIIQANENVSDGDGLSAFSDIDGKSYNPQVFIPFYEELKKSGKLGAENPVLVIFNGKRKEKDLEDAYIIKEGIFSKAEFQVDGEYAKSHEVWVLSINDRTGGDLDRKTIVQPESDQQASEKGARLATARQFPYISNVGIYQDKESWASGANDVYFECVYTNGPASSNTTDYTTGYVGDWSASQMGEVRAVDIILKQLVKTPDNIALFGTYGGSTGDAYGNKYHAFVLYEQDNFPVGINVAYIPIEGNQVEIGYRSAESSYMQDFTDARSNLLLLNSVYYFDKNNGAARVKTIVRTY